MSASSSPDRIVASVRFSSETLANASSSICLSSVLDLFDSFLDALGVFEPPGSFEALVELVNFAFQGHDFVDRLLDHSHESVMLQVAEFEGADFPGDRDAVARQHGKMLFIKAGTFAATA